MSVPALADRIGAVPHTYLDRGRREPALTHSQPAPPPHAVRAVRYFDDVAGAKFQLNIVGCLVMSQCISVERMTAAFLRHTQVTVKLHVH